MNTWHNPTGHVRKKVLIVDDNITYLEWLKAYLSINPSLEVYPVSSGETFLAQLKTGADIIILDLNLKPRFNRNGLDYLKLVKKMLPRTRVIILSGERESHMLDQAIQAGTDAWVYKSHNAFKMLNDVLLKMIH